MLERKLNNCLANIFNERRLENSFNVILILNNNNLVLIYENKYDNIFYLKNRKINGTIYI